MSNPKNTLTNAGRYFGVGAFIIGKRGIRL